MSAQPQLDLTGPRLSSLALGCPRQCYYQAIDAPKRAPTLQEQRWWRRGHAVSNAIRYEILSELRADGQRPRREEPIPWPAGTGHADLYVPADQRVVEVTSIAGAKLEDHKARQAAAYAHHHPNASEAFVLAVDPNSFEDRWFPIDISGHVAKLTALEDELVHALQTGEAPERRCTGPWDAQQYHCHYADVCFADWSPPPVDVILDQAVIDTISELALADEEIREIKHDLADAEAARKALRDQARDRLPLGETLQAGAHTVKLTRSAQRRFSLAQCIAAGHSLPEDLEAFVSESDVERWSIREVAS